MRGVSGTRALVCAFIAAVTAGLALAAPALAAPPPNDTFAAATTLTAATGSFNGTNREATKEAGEQDHAGNPGGASAWYRWLAPASGSASFEVFDPGFDSIVAVYSGTALNALQPVAASAGSAVANGKSSASFTTTRGTTYWIVVDGYNRGSGAATGTFALNWSLAPVTGGRPANDSFATAETFDGTGGIVGGSSLGATKEAGEPSHAGNPGGSSVWFRWRAPATGLWRFYTPLARFDTVVAVYTGVSVAALVEVGANDDVAWNNRTSSLAITATRGTVYSIVIDGHRDGWSIAASSGDYELWWQLDGPQPDTPSNDLFAHAQIVEGEEGPVAGSNRFASKEPGEPAHAGNAGGASIWFKWTAPHDGRVYFDTPGSGFDTVLAIYTGTTLADLQPVASNDDIAFNHWYPTVQLEESYAAFIAEAGRTYYIAVDGSSSAGSIATGSIFLDWWLYPPAGDAALVAAGDVASCSGTGDDSTAQLIAQNAGATVAALGNLANPSGSVSDFACYDASWGAARDRTRPAPGPAEYRTAGAGPYFSYFGAAAGLPGKGYYSYELEGWHVVVLNSNCAVAGCAAGSAQERWLRADLQAHRSDCTLAYWHQPLFSASVAAAASVRPLWEALYAAGADVVLSSGAAYERFAPQAPGGAADVRGLREFVVGTGGNALSATGASVVNREFADSRLGVLRLDLRPLGYEWEFLPTDGTPAVDRGAAGCDGLGAPAQAPSAPGTPAPVMQAGSLSLQWTPSVDLDGSSVSYTLQHMPHGDLGFTTVASGIGSPSYNFNGSPERQGTWIYRVQAHDGVLASEWSTPSGPVVIDRTAPNMPAIMVDREPDYVGNAGWYRDSVTFSFRDNGDPKLPDGSAGSGVDPASVPASFTRRTSGTVSVSALVRDRAGNKSGQASAVVRVDATAPAISVICPLFVKRGSIATATWWASDAESGLASSTAAGNIRLDTSKSGKRFPVTVSASDRVGHTRSASCTYDVA